MLMPLARTPDKKGASSLNQYQKKVDKVLTLPWQKAPNRLSVRKGDEQVSQVRVILDSTDSPNDPLYKGAQFAKE